MVRVTLTCRHIAEKLERVCILLLNDGQRPVTIRAECEFAFRIEPVRIRPMPDRKTGHHMAVIR